MYAASYCDDSRKILELLIEKGANINFRNKFGWAAIHHAAFRGCTTSVKVLLENKADSDVIIRKLGYRSTPLDLAILGKRTDIIAILSSKQRIQELQYFKETKLAAIHSRIWQTFTKNSVLIQHLILLKRT